MKIKCTFARLFRGGRVEGERGQLFPPEKKIQNIKNNEMERETL